MRRMSDITKSSSEQLAKLAAELFVCLRFCTRIPIPRLDFEPPPKDASIAAAAPMLPVAGAIIGVAAAIVLCFFAKLGLPTSLAVLIAIASLMVLTGGLHEDGLADCADALGGATSEQRLAIMKDSRVGTFGSLALVISVIARVMSVAILADHSLGLAAAVLISAAASSRSFALLPLYILPPARSEGLGATTHPRQRDLLVIGIATVLISLVPIFAGADLPRIFIALILSAGAAYGTTSLARHLIGGQTGDVAGATQQIAELTTYLVFTAWL
ncbi:MAG: adenosylcobinamide-GDP ribazoletransferase [Beijerinckiaceae bacterium]|nr:MAG: adenosylcobinamide-GDP ribazoletransferase [Beijerinckiaceae bacterium]